jgi:anti-anti-sigma factor
MQTYCVETDMDATRVEAMREVFERLSTSDDDVTIDIARVRFIDSSGVGAIVFLFKRLKMRGRNLMIANAQGQPQRLFIQLRLTFLLAPPPRSSAA